MLQVQYHGITDAANLETWRGMSYQTVLTPEDQKTGELILSLRQSKVTPLGALPYAGLSLRTGIGKHKLVRAKAPLALWPG